MTFDRKRLDFGWTQMTLPDGTQIDLGQADGGDASGTSGVGGEGHHALGERDCHRRPALRVRRDGDGARPPPPATRWPRAIATSIGRSTSDVGREVTRRSLSVEPKISIPAGDHRDHLPAADG